MNLENERYKELLESEDIKGMRAFAHDIVSLRLEDDSDIQIAITGEPGTGKSTLGIWIGWLINRDSKKVFNLVKNIAYIPDQKDVIKQYNDIQSKTALIIDEAVRGMHKHQWANKMQQLLVQMFNTERYQNKATILIMPRFKDLGEYFRNERVRVWIHVQKRGTGIVYVKDLDEHIGMEDPWHFKENIKIKQKIYKGRILTSQEERLNAAVEANGFLGIITFPQLPYEIEEEYKRLKLESRKPKTEAEEEEPTTMGARKYRDSLRLAVKLIKTKLKITNRDIGKAIGIRETIVSLWLNTDRLQEAKEVIDYSITQSPEKSTPQKDYLSILHKGQVPIVSEPSTNETIKKDLIIESKEVIEQPTPQVPLETIDNTIIERTLIGSKNDFLNLKKTPGQDEQVKDDVQVDTRINGGVDG